MICQTIHDIDPFLFWYQHNLISILEGQSKRSIDCWYSIHYCEFYGTSYKPFSNTQVLLVKVLAGLFFSLFSLIPQLLLERQTILHNHITILGRHFYRKLAHTCENQVFFLKVIYPSLWKKMIPIIIKF